VTVPTRPESSRGWQATPGQPIPRAARQPTANGLLLVMLLLVWFSPLSILAWLVGQAVILLQRRWHCGTSPSPPSPRWAWCWP
jgi:hypothetical protein